MTVNHADSATLFLCGDVMTGRGVDQILAHPSRPRIFEPYVDDAREYVELAERRSGPVPRRVTGAYIWGDALDELERVQPDVRIVNLETSITVCDDCWKGKGINYRMHPANVDCLTAARIDVCAVANNHVLDYGHAGLVETLETLRRAGIKAAGAGRILSEARTPAIVALAKGVRVIVFALGTESSGVPLEWEARVDRPGIDLLPDLSETTAAGVCERAHAIRRPRDIVVASIHWGTNWGYDVPRDHRRFARRLVDGGIDIVHGHSSHHPRPIEVYRNRLILYGCGDFIDDYEGIEGYEQYRDDLAVMYFVTVSAVTGELTALDMTPMQIRKLKLNRTADADAHWLRDTIDGVSVLYGTRLELLPDGTLALRWRRTTLSV